ncbi:hypothetical protein TNCV_1742361 [Trichonephila clavipes]|nr:hypothetical protein TNCV_1742361 [Trichonephila clavipes]
MSSFLGFCEWNTRNRWRDGQVCPDVDKELWRLGPDSSGVLCANRKKEEVKRDFGDLRIRRSEGLVVNTPLVFKRVLFEDRRNRRERKKEGEDQKERKKGGQESPRKSRKKGQESPGERDSEARLEWRKRAESEIGVKKTMNAGGVEYGNMN